MKKAETEMAYFRDEADALQAYSKSHFIEVVQDVGFACDGCGKCCTRTFNGHVYLLGADAERMSAISPDAVEASPYFGFCDQEGRFYVSGYCLKTKNDEAGSCIFLENNRCRIYENRPLICRVYPYMIHRETDDSGVYEWREISGLNEHGEYGAEINENEAAEIYRITEEYESKYISQEMEFLRALSDRFEKNHLMHIQKIYDRQIRAFEKGETVTIFVYHNGAFFEHAVQK